MLLPAVTSVPALTKLKPDVALVARTKMKEKVNIIIPAPPIKV